jgi:hypothetical protein
MQFEFGLDQIQATQNRLSHRCAGAEIGTCAATAKRAYAGRKLYAVPFERIVLVLVPVVVGCIAFYAVLRRHRCAYNDPLCRRSRPCIACYRELYYGRRADSK